MVTVGFDIIDLVEKSNTCAFNPSNYLPVMKVASSIFVESCISVAAEDQVESSSAGANPPERKLRPSGIEIEICGVIVSLPLLGAV